MQNSKNPLHGKVKAEKEVEWEEGSQNGPSGTQSSMHECELKQTKEGGGGRGGGGGQKGSAAVQPGLTPLQMHNWKRSRNTNTHRTR